MQAKFGRTDFLDHPRKKRKTKRWVQGVEQYGDHSRFVSASLPLRQLAHGLFSRVHMRKCLPNFRSIHLIRKARVSFGLRETSMEFSAWASDSCSFVLKKSSLCRFGDGSCGARLGREWWDGCMWPCVSFAARVGSGGSTTCWVGFAIRTYHTFAAECLGRLCLATASWAVIAWLASAWQPWGTVVFMSFQLSLLRGKPGRAYSKKNHQINGVAPSARWRLKCWHSMNQNLQAGVLAHLTSDSIKQVWCCFFPGLSSTTSLKQFHVSRLGKIVIQFYQVLGLWNGWPWVALNYINFILEPSP